MMKSGSNSAWKFKRYLIESVKLMYTAPFQKGAGGAPGWSTRACCPRAARSLFFTEHFQNTYSDILEQFLIHDLILYPITDVNNYKIYNYDSTSLEAWLNQQQFKNVGAMPYCGIERQIVTPPTATDRINLMIALGISPIINVIH